MEIARTPDERFDGLDGYPFEPHYLTITDRQSATPLRMHFVDVGPRTGAVVLMLHGEPSWSYLYRKLIPIVAAAGQRVIAPDLIGFGRSDKPLASSDYSYQRHVDWLQDFIVGLDLQQITLVCQDWGGLLGLRMLAAMPERFARVVAANTFLPTGDSKAGEAFLQWREYSQTVPVFPAASIVARGCVRPLSAAVQAAYDAPFPEERYKAGARAFPMLVPISPDDPAAAPNREAWTRLMQFQRPFLTAFSDSDPITRGADAVLQRLIPGARGQAHTTLKNGGHFLQEDCGEELARVVVEFIAASAQAR